MSAIARIFNTIRWIAFLAALTISTIIPPVNAEGFKIGAIFSLSGWGESGGVPELHGALVALDEVNRSDAWRGKHSLQLAVEDNQSNMRQTASALRKLVAHDRVSGIIGPNWLEFFEPAVPVAKELGIPIIGTTGYRADLLSEGSPIFSLWPSHDIALIPLLNYLKRSGVKSLEILLSPNAYYESLHKSFLSLAPSFDLTSITTTQIENGTLDFRSTILKLKSRRPDAVLALLMETGEQSAFFRQRTQLKLRLPIFSANGIPFDSEIQSDPSLADGVIYFDYLISGRERLSNEIKRRFGSEMNFGTSKAYDAVWAFAHAIQSCQFKLTNLPTCIRSVDFEGASGQVSFDSDGHLKSSLSNTTLLQVRGNKFKPLD